APVAPLEVRHAPALEPQLLARLRAAGKVDLLGAVEGGQLQVGAEGGLGEAIVGPYADVDVEVAAGAAARPGRAATAEAQRGPGVDAGGDVDRVGALLHRPTVPAAGGARLGDDLARSRAARAHRGRDHL